MTIIEIENSLNTLISNFNKETFIFLTKTWEDLKLKALEIPEKLIKEFNFDEKYLKDLHANLWQFLGKI